MKSVKTDWEKYALKEAYYSVTTNYKYRNENLSDEVKDDFFIEAKQYAEKLTAVIRTHLVKDFAPKRILDFGCGVGRTSILFTELAEEVVGTDVSENMLREAEKNKHRRGADNLNLIQTGSDLSNIQGRFDFVHSLYVFQHIPLSEGRKLLTQLLDKLEDNGVIAFHILYANELSLLKRISYWLRLHIPCIKNVLNLIRRKPWDAPMMQLNSYPVNDIAEDLKQAGCLHFYSRYTNHAGYKGLFIFAQKTRLDEENVTDLGEIP
ncbi:putative methyltransferase YcgJ [Sedimentisphaera cyanobacteriorum]|uniref:Putative methyltransferase YcgJ n=1 Tax=Sedimentisphaera cyanobacteriorum TaxID=1940790 RepID=A0A1Q2HLV1_9BACT|nr:class I SAM-dependent methyltransferase [Sedimentisphaera cyanobacteriorum]AQQ08234.1 putative methyltransferase YcgJ [Sedimentisphaera cyanobacteriorum]